jgi:hypothetical protein
MTTPTKTKALELLDSITQHRTGRFERPTELLHDPEAEQSEGWFMHVPRCFNRALDIRRTPRVPEPNCDPVMVWTQGREFTFEKGDTIYDTPNAYLTWSKALQHIRLCLLVTSATGATSPPAPELRSAGSVAFEVLIPNNDKTRLVLSACHVLTQDAFIRLLISGEGLPEQAS